MNAGGERKRRMGVPEVVEPDPRQLRRLRLPLEGVREKLAVAIRRERTFVWSGTISKVFVEEVVE
jgi:hypothetical protein